MAISKFLLPSSAVDTNFQVLGRIAAAFAPHESDPRSMSVVVDPGHFMVSGTLVETATQLVGPFAAPTANPRIDRIVVNIGSGAALLVAGVEAADAVPPALQADQIPVARVRLTPQMTAITSEHITDERDFSRFGTTVGGALLNVQRFTTSGTYIPTLGTNRIIVEVMGGGGGGGGTAATSSNQVSVGGGGGAGSFARAMFTTGITTTAVTVGRGVDAGAAGADGTPGNASSFGTLVVVPGGRGGAAGAAVSPPTFTRGCNTSDTPTGGNLLAANGEGGHFGFGMNLSTVGGGRGGTSIMGANSTGSSNGPGSGTAASSNGAGGGGGSSLPNSPARSGGAAHGGFVTVYEYA